MRRLRTISLGLILVAPTLASTTSGLTRACAASTSGAPHAALVVDTGSQTLTYCVELDGGSVSGIHLIQLAGAQFGLQYRLGFGGAAVCQLAGAGVDGGDCFGAYPDFWGYWHGNGAGGWSWAGSGAASASIGDGGMDAWTWGQGDSGTTHPGPPALALEDVCDIASPSPTPVPGDGDGSVGDPPQGGSGGGGGSGGVTGTSAGTTGNTPIGGTPAGSRSASSRSDPRSDAERGRDEDPASTASATSADPVTALAAGVADDPGGGPPWTVIFALIAITVFGAAGWFMRRRGDGVREG